MPAEQSNIHSLYIVIFVLLILSLIYHVYLHHELQIPDEKNPPKEKTYSLLVNNMHSNMLKAFIFGVITSADGGYSTAIKNAATYGIISPLVLYLGY